MGRCRAALTETGSVLSCYGLLRASQWSGKIVQCVLTVPGDNGGLCYGVLCF